MLIRHPLTLELERHGLLSACALPCIVYMLMTCGLQDVKLATRFLEGLLPEVSRPLVLFFGKVDAALDASKQLSNQVCLGCPCD